MPILLVLQAALLVAWYTVAPTLPWWVVFFPMLPASLFVAIAGVMLLLGAGAVGVAGLVEILDRRRASKRRISR
jgi:hypothetical protein